MAPVRDIVDSRQPEVDDPSESAKRDNLENDNSMPAASIVEPELDLARIAPSKINQFKFVIDRFM